MAVEKISLNEIEDFKREEEMKNLDETYFEGLDDAFIDNENTKTVIKKSEDGKVTEYLFVPDGGEDETLLERQIDAAVENIPECTPEYVSSEMERTGASAEEVIADYISLVEMLIDENKDNI